MPLFFCACMRGRKEVSYSGRRSGQKHHQRKCSSTPASGQKRPFGPSEKDGMPCRPKRLIVLAKTVNRLTRVCTVFRLGLFWAVFCRLEVGPRSVVAIALFLWGYCCLRAWRGAFLLGLWIFCGSINEIRREVVFLSPDWVCACFRFGGYHVSSGISGLS